MFLYKRKETGSSVNMVQNLSKISNVAQIQVHKISEEDKNKDSDISNQSLENTETSKEIYPAEYGRVLVKSSPQMQAYIKLENLKHKVEGNDASESLSEVQNIIKPLLNKKILNDDENELVKEILSEEFEAEIRIFYKDCYLDIDYSTPQGKLYAKIKPLLQEKINAQENKSDYYSEMLRSVKKLSYKKDLTEEEQHIVKTLLDDTEIFINDQYQFAVPTQISKKSDVLLPNNPDENKIDKKHSAALWDYVYADTRNELCHAYTLNSTLRREKELTQNQKEAIALLDEIIDNSQATKLETIVYRQISFLGARLNMQENSIFDEKGYVSTSPTPGNYYYGYAERIKNVTDPKFGNYIMRIKLPKGTKGIDVRKIDKSGIYVNDAYLNEFILPRNSKYKINKIDKEKGIIDAEYILPEK